MKKILGFLFIAALTFTVQAQNQITFSNQAKAKKYLTEGINRFSQNDFDGAIFSLSLSINFNPYDPDAFIYRGRSKAKKLNYMEAIDDLDKALNLKKNAEIFYEKGLIHEKIRNYEFAIKDYSEALAVDSTNVNSILRRSLCLSKIGEIDEAINDINIGIAFKPTDLNAYYYRSGLYSQVQEFEKAILDLDYILSADTNRISVLGLRGYYHFILENYEQSYADLKKFTTSFPNSEDKFFEMLKASEEKLEKK